jgi:apolipoprotein N-acyltransferase
MEGTLVDIGATYPRSTGVWRELASYVILATGWRRRLIALGSGACGALALAPLHFAPAAILPMTAAVWLIDGSQGLGARAALRAAFGAGWWWGFGFFIAGLWWLGAAFLVEADKFAWALPFGVLAVPAGLGLFPALGFLLARAVWSPGATRILALAAGLGVAEWLRALALTGFPWNELGMVLGDHLMLAQIASIGGLHALTLLTVAIFATPATLADERRATWFREPAFFALVALCAIAAFGALRLSATGAETVGGVKLRIMQANVAQDANFRPENKDSILRRYLTLSDRATSPEISGVADVTHLIWPESAFPFLVARDASALSHIADLLHGGATLIAGAARMAERAPGDRRNHYFNSIQVIDRGGNLLGRYDKARLVPFGEYMPFTDLFDRLGISGFVHIPGGFDPGRGPASLEAPGLPLIWPMVCYESIFPAEIGSLLNDRPRAGLILNVTDDAWFGLTPGPRQHFDQARLRSVEQGLPLVRAANTGISAVVDSAGRVIAELPLGVEGVLDSALPAALPPTIYARLGFLVPASLLLCFLVTALVGRRRRTGLMPRRR